VSLEPTHRHAGTDFEATEFDIDADTAVIALAGEIDLYTAPEFKQCVTDAITRGKRRLVIDLSAVGFIDSTALGVLVGAVKRLRPLGGYLAVAGSGPETLALFKISGLDRVFTLYPNRQAALRGIAEAA
jgi:anti-sigma B factor antagonist